MYKTDPSIFEKMYVMRIRCNGDNSYLFINGTQELKFKAKDSEIKRNKFCIGNISEDFLVTNMEKTGLYGNVYDVSVDYWPHIVSKMYDTQRFNEKIETYGV